MHKSHEELESGVRNFILSSETRNPNQREKIQPLGSAAPLTMNFTSIRARAGRIPHSLSLTNFSALKSPELKNPSFDERSEIPGPTEITPHMYLGSKKDALDDKKLEKYGITKVINITEDSERSEKFSDDCYLRIPIKDSNCAKILPHFEEAYSFIEGARCRGEKVLLHCIGGISRSPTLAIAYVMRSKRLPTDDAFHFVKKLRPSVSPNFNFLGQLMEYEKQLREQQLLPSPPLPDSGPPKEAGNVQTPNEPRSIYPKLPLYDSEELPYTDKSDILRTSISASSLLNSISSSPHTPLYPVLDPRNENGKRPLNAAHYSTWLDLPKGTEDMPSPSTEFAKLDLSLSNPFFGIQRKNTSNIPKTPKNEQKDNTFGNTNVSNPMFDLPSLAEDQQAGPSTSCSNKSDFLSKQKSPARPNNLFPNKLRWFNTALSNTNSFNVPDDAKAFVKQKGNETHKKFRSKAGYRCLAKVARCRHLLPTLRETEMEEDGRKHDNDKSRHKNMR